MVISIKKQILSQNQIAGKDVNQGVHLKKYRSFSLNNANNRRPLNPIET